MRHKTNCLGDCARAGQETKEHIQGDIHVQTDRIRMTINLI